MDGLIPGWLHGKAKWMHGCCIFITCMVGCLGLHACMVGASVDKINCHWSLSELAEMHHSLINHNHGRGFGGGRWTEHRTRRRCSVKGRCNTPPGTAAGVSSSSSSLQGTWSLQKVGQRIICVSWLNTHRACETPSVALTISRIYLNENLAHDFSLWLPRA